MTDREWSERQAVFADRDRYNFYVRPHEPENLRRLVPERVWRHYQIWRMEQEGPLGKAFGFPLWTIPAALLGTILATSDDEALADFQPDLPQPAVAKFMACVVKDGR